MCCSVLYLSLLLSPYTHTHTLSFLSYTHTDGYQSPTPRPGSMTKGRSLRSGRTIPDPMEPQRVDSIDSEPVMISESSESEADEWKSDSDSDESSDVSDWTAEAGIKFINKSQRKRRRRKSSNHEDELSSEDEYGEEEGEDGDLGPSKRAEQRKERSSEGLLGPAVVKRETKPKKKRLVSLSLYCSRFLFCLAALHTVHIQCTCETQFFFFIRNFRGSRLQAMY